MAALAQPGQPLHTGWMHKRGHIIRNWKNRFFVLTIANEGARKCYRLLYFKDQSDWEDTPPTGAITILGASFKVDDAPAGMYGFTVTTAQGKPYPMRCGSDEERQTWLARLSQALESETTMPNMSISGPSTSQSLPAKPTGGAGGAASPPSRRPSAFLGEIGGTRRPGGMGPSGAGGAGAAGGGKRGSIKPMHLNTSVQVTDFDLLKVVGKGAFGKVFLVKKREGANSDQLYAMKVLDKEVIAEKQQVAHTKSERDILHEIQHPFIVMMHYAFQTERKLYMVTDYYPGGNLFAHVQRSRRTGGFDEERARFYAAELCLALDFLHQNNIVYRDLKLENILMDMDGHIVLTDFGLSKDKVEDIKENSLQTFCGTVEYMAPELVKGQKYSVAVDWWSYGVLVYEMMCTRTPFFHQKGRKAIFQGIIKNDPQFPMHFSGASQDFISKLLAKEANRRMGMGREGAADIQNHSWFTGLDWDKLFAKEVSPPWTPDVKNVMDFKYVPKRLQAADARDSEIEDGTGAAEVSAGAKWDEFTFVQKSKLNDS